MDWQGILTTIWDALNSPVGIAAVAGLLLWLLNRLYAAKPGWAKYEGAIIAGVKFAEKQIPDDAESKGLRRLDAALRYVLKAYEEATGRRATAKVAAELKEGIQVKHAELEAAGNLHPADSGDAR
jgi:hypothetical protein